MIAKSSHCRTWSRRNACCAWLLAVVFQASAQAESAYKVDWSSQFGDTGACRADGISADSAGNICVCGWAGRSPDETDSRSPGGFLTKYNAQGKRLWARNFETSAEDRSSAISTDGSGNVYVSGYAAAALGPDNRDSYLSKFDPQGQLAWTRLLAVSSKVWTQGVSTDTAGNVCVIGYCCGALEDGPEDGSRTGFLRKYDGEGNILWTRRLEADALFGRLGVACDVLGNVYVSGAGSLDGSHPAASRAFVSKYDAFGNPLWTRQSDSMGDTLACGVSANHLGHVFSSGCVTEFNDDLSTAPRCKAYVTCYDAEGNLAWTKRLGAAWSECTSVSADANGNVYISGRTADSIEGPNSGGCEAFVSKFDVAGRLLWTRQFGTGDMTSTRGITADRTGNVYMAGITYGSLFRRSSGGREAFLIKLVPATGLRTWMLATGSIAFLFGLRFLIGRFR